MVKLRRTESVRRSVTNRPRSRRCGEQRAFRRSVTCGILLPALRAHLERRPSREVAEMIDAMERRLRALVVEGKPGLPVRYWVIDGKVTGEVRLRGVPEGFMLLEGVAPAARARCLARGAVSGDWPVYP